MKSVNYQKAGRWPLAVIIVTALCLSAPIAATLIGALFDTTLDREFWTGAGRRYATGTIFLCVFVGLGASIIGAVAAMLISLTEFPGRRIFQIALALPFAIPAYVAAYAYGDFLGPFGPAATLLGAQNLPEIRSMAGAIFILVLMTYPYVYFALSASLAHRSAAYMEAARSLGATPRRAAIKILLASGRPALAGGLALALMETAADFGVADYFGVSTLSVGIFRTWQGMGDLAGATQLAALLFFIALILVLIEEASRRGESTDHIRAHRKSARLRLSPAHASLAILFCAAPALLGFVIPAGVLLAKLDPVLSISAVRGLYTALANTAAAAFLGGVIVIALALILALSARRVRSNISSIFLRAATLGYAIPGAVIAIGVLAVTSRVAPLSSASAAAGVSILIYAYIVRFITAGYNAVAGGMAQISPQMDAAARLLGASPYRILKDVHWPQLRSAAFAGGAIVMIDIAKELPATLLLRPFNFETLASRIYRLAADERLADAAPAALLLICFGLAPTLFLSAAAKINARKT